MVLLRRSSCKASAGGDQSKGGGNAGTSHVRKSKGGGKNVASAPAAVASSSTPAASGKQEAQKGAGNGGGGGNWKGRKSGWEARFLFKEPEAAGDADTQASQMDTRTTVMIRNIPNKYRYPCQSLRTLLAALQQCYISWARTLR